ncbi:RES family NAD+ phosphorylase [Cupriavidus alkaliphilus]|uniref:RES family NAD+ phosphorylase n=1 Tax=Cupriavidus alkaliphilus TaxID=942866 RepID=UPI000815850A|nr:RES family NAD+ phosphorylase [Cupriavidus alkaliphilus]SCB34105.1 RES domain-containing protein [Cupriavidus alkaliphilus]
MKPAWRIATDTPLYTADDASGAGGRATGGRWNRQGTPLIYAASSIALACLETLVHLGSAGLPLNRYLVRIDIPDDLWAAARHLTAASAPVGWDAIPAGKTSLDTGEAWVREGTGALLLVPSIVIPEEFNVLVNPLHAAARRLAYTKVRRWQYDARLA